MTDYGADEEEDVEEYSKEEEENKTKGDKSNFLTKFFIVNFQLKIFIQSIISHNL